MDHEEQIPEIFDCCAGEYDRWFESPKGSALFGMEAGAVRLLMKGLKKPFLEIGVGTGRFARELGIEYGIDPSQKALEIAEMRGIKVRKARAEKLPFDNASFGGVFLLFTLCFVEDPAKTLAEAVRVLRDDGGLIVGIINRESPWGELYGKKKSEGHSIYSHARFFSPSEVAQMIEKAGMAVRGYASALFQPPSEKPHKEDAQEGLVESAGFVCILAYKKDRRS